MSLTVQQVGDGEVSTYLVEGMELGDQLEVRGPIGGWFVWAPSPEAPVEQPVLLVGGGSGVVPLMAMLRQRTVSASAAPFRLVYSVRDPDQVIYARELAERAGDDGLQVDLLYTRTAPEGFARPAGRITADDLAPPDGWVDQPEAPRLRLRADRLRRARHRPAPGARLHQPHDPRRTLRSLRRQP